MAIPFWDTATDGYEGPVYAKNPWDLVILNGFRSPGVATVKCIPQVKIDLPKEVARDGGPATEKGHVPAKVDIQIKIWTPDQWDAMQNLMEAIWRQPGQKYRLELVGGILPQTSTTGTGDKTKAKPAITIAHPCCALYGVTAVMLESPESPDSAPEVGAKIIRLKGVQYIARSNQPADRKVRGARVPLAPELQGTKSAPPFKPPSQTDGVPLLLQRPEEGGS
jgi:hypothetical protein